MIDCFYFRRSMDILLQWQTVNSSLCGQFKEKNCLTRLIHKSSEFRKIRDGILPAENMKLKGIFFNQI